MAKFFYIVFTMLIPLWIHAQAYQISILKPKSLTVTAQLEYEGIIRDSIRRHLSLIKNYRVNDDAVVEEILSKNNITIETLMLEEDLVKICRLLKSDILIYPLVSSVDQQVISYIKIVSVDEQTVNFKNEMEISDPEFQQKYYTFTDEAIQSIKNILPYKRPPIDPLRATGITLVSIGATATITGGVLFFYDIFYYFPLVRTARDQHQNREIPYSDYTAVYDTNIRLFASSVAVFSAGILFIGISLPFFLIKPTPKKHISLDLSLSPYPEVGITIRF